MAVPPPFPPPLLARRSLRRLCLAAGLLAAGPLFAAKTGDSLSLQHLESLPNLTPKSFANLFEDFDYEYYPYVQSPHAFLRKRRGDCDDYAILADHVLGRRGYKTRLIRVQLVDSRINHVVCYLTEQKAYLDYNNRRVFFTLARSGPTLREIAEKVADSFEKNWVSVTEYTYNYERGRQQPVHTVVKTEPPELDPDRQPPR